MHAQPPGPWNNRLSMCQSNPTAATEPQRPGIPWTAKASMGSSTLSRRSATDVSTKKPPPTAPMATEAQTVTVAQPAEIETKPAKMPLQKLFSSYLSHLLPRKFSTNATTPPMAAATVLFMATCAAVMASAMPFILPVSPQLKPYQPNHRTNVPQTTSGALCGLNRCGASQRPARGPATMAPARPTTPPQMWITLLPAKSKAPTSLT
mmetsp:Transcript_60082/g.173252  ORF Transcript_60082/g.173252 Transcript_60082/m.173252 type:complete len:207 (-) Transcript_60082:829-1449(-)